MDKKIPNLVKRSGLRSLLSREGVCPQNDTGLTWNRGEMQITPGGTTEGSIMIRPIIVAALLLGGAADAAFADHPVPDPIWLTVDSGADLRLSSPTFWDRACNPLSVTVTVTQPPAHGVVSVVTGLNRANPNPRFGTPGPCGGTLIMGKRVISYVL